MFKISARYVSELSKDGILHLKSISPYYGQCHTIIPIWEGRNSAILNWLNHTCFYPNIILLTLSVRGSFIIQRYFHVMFTFSANAKCPKFLRMAFCTSRVSLHKMSNVIPLWPFERDRNNWILNWLDHVCSILILLS